MEVYTGKLNWLNYAVDEPVILILPRGLERDAPVLMFWRWTKDSHGLANQAPIKVETTLTAVYNTKAPTIVTEATFGSYYSFKLIRASGNTGLTLEMSKESGAASFNNELTRVYDYPLSPMRTLEVYAGKLNWASHAHQELFFVIFPEGLKDGKDIGFFWGWTSEGARGEAKGPAAYQASTYVTFAESGDSIHLQSTINKDQYYVKGGQKVDESGEASEDSPLILAISLEGKEDQRSDDCELKLECRVKY